MNKQLRFQTLSISILTAMSISAFAKDSSEDATKLKTIVVTASSQAVDVKEAPASISVITSEDIEKQPVGSLGELLSKVPGVTGGISPSKEGSKIKLRGLPDNEPYRVCRRVNILRDYSDEKTKLYPRN